MCRRYFAVILCTSFLVLLTFAQPMSVEPTNLNCDDCDYWLSKVDQSIRLPRDTPEKDEKDEGNVIQAIDCLLKLKGNTNPTAFSAVVSMKLLEAKLPTPTIEIAALYKISTIYYQNRNHANAIVLMDKSRNENTRESIEAAYHAYETWFKKIKEIGLEQCRKKGLDPLADSGVSWY